MGKKAKTKKTRGTAMRVDQTQGEKKKKKEGRKRQNHFGNED